MKNTKEELDKKFDGITIVCPNKGPWRKGEVEKIIDEKIVPERPVIHLTNEEAFYHIERVQNCNPETYGILRLVFTDLPEEPVADRVSDAIREYDKGVQHVAGLIELSLGLPLQYPGIALNWKYPEQYLHPGSQLGLADAIVAIRDHHLNRQKEGNDE